MLYLPWWAAQGCASLCRRSGAARQIRPSSVPKQCQSSAKAAKIQRNRTEKQLFIPKDSPALLDDLAVQVHWWYIRRRHHTRRLFTKYIIK